MTRFWDTLKTLDPSKMLLVIFGGEISPFCGKKVLQYFVTIFKKKIFHEKNENLFKKITKNHHSYLQYEKVFKILYFHILNITKFG